MDEQESVLEAIYDEEEEDVEMVDVEEGELVEQNLQIDLGQSIVGGGLRNEASEKKNRKRRENKKRNRKRRRGGGGEPNVTDINRFVLDICRRLKEKKSYMVYTAVGCLGVSALSDMVKQVDAIQSCGGQMTADGRRFRNGGGILWNIMKTREPNAYKEIMTKAKEFEKQFKPQNIRQVPPQNKESASEEIASLTDGSPSSVPYGFQHAPQKRHEQSCADQQRRSVIDRIRVPVSYDDLHEDDIKKDSA